MGRFSDTFRPTSERAKFARVNRSVEDPNMVTVVAGFETLESGGFLDSSPGTRGSKILYKSLAAANVWGDN